MIYQENSIFKVVPFKAIYSDKTELITNKEDFERYLKESISIESNISLDEVELPTIEYLDVELTNGQSERFKEVKDIVGITLDEVRNYTIDNIEPKSLGYKIYKSEIESLNPTERYERLKDSVSLDKCKELKLESLKYECTQSIYEGFTSSVDDYEFGFNEHDQANFTQMSLRLIQKQTPLSEVVQWKTKNNGIISFTVEQFNQILDDGEAHKLNNQVEYWQLESQLLKAETKEDIYSIVWQS